MIRYQLFPRNLKITSELQAIVNCFLNNEKELDEKSGSMKSNDVLELLRSSLEKENYKVEKNKKEKIEIPVLFGENNTIEKKFEADALSKDETIVVEIEAGRGYTNHQFLKDIFEASMMLDVEYLVLGIKNTYITKDSRTKKNKKNKDYEKVKIFLDTLYASNRLQLPLKGILLIGYGK